MKKTKTKPEEPKPQSDLDEFEQFVKNLLSVPKEEIEEIRKRDKEKTEEENQSN